MKKKTILVLQWVNFCFQNTWQSKDCIFRITCVGSLTEETWFSKTDISLISFQQLDLNWHDLWNMRVDSTTRKIVKQQEHRPNLQNPWQEWHQHFLTLLEKLTTWWQYSGPWEGKQWAFRSTGGNERWLNDESVYWRQCCSKKDNQWTSTFRSYWGQCCSKIVHDLVNPVNNRESKDTLEGNLLKHGYRPMWA